MRKTLETIHGVLDKLMVLSNDVSLTESAVTRYVGSIENLDEVIAFSPDLTKVGFALRWDAHSFKHSIPETIEPWILKMQLSGGSAFSQLRDKLDATHLVSYRGDPRLPYRQPARGLPQGHERRAADRGGNRFLQENGAAHVLLPELHQNGGSHPCRSRRL